MSVFKEHKSQADRSASDRRRHRGKIERAIKEGIHHIVSEESIIGQDGKKKIKIPVKGIKEYRFVYGENSKKTGSAQGKDVKRGQVVGQKQKGDDGAAGGKPGNKPGEEFYEVEITLEELAHYLFDDLELPDLEKKQMKKLLSEKFKRKGYRNEGIRPRLDKKESLKRMLKRKNAAIRVGSHDPDEDSFSFAEDDLRYKHIKKSTKEQSNAVIFFLMDISGSMTKNKKYLARSFFFLLYHFVRYKYEKTELVFVSHDVEAYEVNEEQFFNRGSGGGTVVSSGLTMVGDIISKRFHPSSWNIYLFQCSDGDNWPTDNDKVLDLVLGLQKKCQLVGYCEVEPHDEKLRWASSEENKLASIYKFLQDDNIKTAFIGSSSDIWPAFKSFFGGKLPSV